MARRRRPTPPPKAPRIAETALSRLLISDTDGAASLPIIKRCFRSNFRSLVSTFPRHPDALQFLLAMTPFKIQFHALSLAPLPSHSGEGLKTFSEKDINHHGQSKRY